MEELEQFEALLLRWAIEFGPGEQDRIDLKDFFNQMKHFFASEP